MKEATVVLKNEEGLHARAAAMFVRKANQYTSDITLTSEQEEVNAKSIIGIMSLGIFSGQEMLIRADGADEDEAIQGLVELIESGIK
ncbi:HPr family phosphocarrier protein [Peptoniphilus sp. KCTC 25270]|uniref:HPr family phosphocarrier protein n=1 Tax=Peptoniphilus sp. KCTC 25270 TaxID=2897414 RepID=UPI001E318A7E|nr:HPr family phosphocarrier protein [Peptoniphilus sp. KCTC 25270]MCD1146721.1 HPr family phosphocarrier protein [Peptoniphilus sp. KCTC 25270]